MSVWVLEQCNNPDGTPRWRVILETTYGDATICEQVWYPPVMKHPGYWVPDNDDGAMSLDMEAATELARVLPLALAELREAVAAEARAELARKACGLPVNGGTCARPAGHGGHTQDGGCSTIVGFCSFDSLEKP